jgi:hypothetical protein
MSNVLEALQADFKLFLQALWEQLDLPSPTRAQYAIADYLQNGPKRLRHGFLIYARSPTMQGGRG